MQQVFLLLGSNIEKEINIRSAIKMVCNISQVIEISSVYETTPMGLIEQPNFFNLAILIESELSPSQIKQHIIDPIENSLNRKRMEDKNAPRTIDVDIILYGDLVLNYQGDDGRIRQLPDPDLLQFVHVAVPVAELAPALTHPITGKMLSTIAGDLLSESERVGETIIWKRDDMDINVIVEN